MVLLNGLRKNSATIFLVIFFASVSLAAANDLSLRPATIAQGNKPARQASRGLTSEYFTEYFNSSSIMITASEHPDMPEGSMNESIEETLAITLHKDGDKITWSLAPYLGKFSLNPIDDINNLQVVLKYRF
jgi:hypothetical protein